MLFLAYIYVCHIKTSILLKPLTLLSWYHLRKAKEQKREHHAQGNLNFGSLDVIGFWSDVLQSRYHNSKIYPWVVSKYTARQTSV